MNDLVGLICILIFLLSLRGLAAALNSGEKNIDDEST